ncbi:FAD-binding oxidoreductase [Roseovarius faecimaris]|uniref:FAD-binding oxidoreductase n=1 Tax=Roseovarius faecimaris TaxID=2494550 RepID=A0A6I6IUZ6_9RHOB|nr:FAD-binding oxidoreductase [Roseovarius faecimaris]QGY00053.1 FAD-binding oxidoreductase [Roseovarius faecimaris]
MSRIFPAHAYSEAPRARCYWPSTASPPDFPTATGEVTADIAIIGAGFTGLNAALHLAEAGRDVVVIEAKTPGWGASGRNGGFCCMGGAAAPDKVMTLRYGDAARAEFRRAEKEATDYVQALLAERGIDADLHSEGETLMAHSRAAIANLESQAEKVERDLGITPTFIPEAELGAHGMSGPFYAALTTPVGIALNPMKYVAGLARAAAKAGARIFTHSPVSAIDRSDAFTLTTPQARIRAKRLIVATNGYSSETLPRWLAGRYLPTQSNVIVTRELTDDEIAAQGWSTHQMCYDERFLTHYFRLMPNKRMLFGMRGGLFSSRASDARMHSTIRRHFQETFPAWADVESPYSWHGLLAISRDLTPFTGPIPGMPGAFTSLCYHGNGVAMGSYAGALLADLVQDKRPSRLYPAIMQRPHSRYLLGRLRRATLWPIFALYALRGE